MGLRVKCPNCGAELAVRYVDPEVDAWVQEHPFIESILEGRR